MPETDPDPVGIDPIDPTGSWQQFRVDEPRRRLALLRELRMGDVQLALGAPQGPVLAAALWAVDDQAGRLFFSVDPQAPGLNRLSTLPDIWAAGYLAEVKLQFPVNDLRMAHPQRVGGPGVADRLHIEAALPLFVYRLPRRHARRVRHARRSAPQLRLRHPQTGADPVFLPAIDISGEGCALWKPVGGWPLLPGMLLRGVEVQLDEQHVIVTSLLVQHVTAQEQAAGPGTGSGAGVRVGCSWVDMHESARETLARWLRGSPQTSALMQLKLD